MNHDDKVLAIRGLLSQIAENTEKCFDTILKIELQDKDKVINDSKQNAMYWEKAYRDLKSQYDDLKDVNDELHGRKIFPKALPANQAPISLEVTDLQKEVEGLREAYNLQKSWLDSANVQITNLQDQIEQLCDSNPILFTELEKERELVFNLNSELDARELQIKGFIDRLDEAEQKNKSLINQLNEWRVLAIAATSRFQAMRDTLATLVKETKTTKICPQCYNTNLIKMPSENKKVCSDCGHEIAWNLDEGQASL